MNIFSLVGKRILVTGASSGIGRACAVLAADLGASVVLTGRRRDALEETWRQMEGKDRHLIIDGDLSDFNFLSSLVAQAGKLDGLVYAAGVGPSIPISIQTKDDVDAVMKVNYYSFVELLRYYSKAKNRTEHFSVVAISSIASQVGWPGVTSYCGSKGALSACVRAAAMELASKGIRVNAVCPGHIDTPMYWTNALGANDCDSSEFKKKQPLGLGKPEQVAGPVCFLLSDAASFITGVNLPVDGGYLAQ